MSRKKTKVQHNKQGISAIQERIIQNLEAIVDEPIAQEVADALRDGVFQVEYGIMDDSFMHPWIKGRKFRDNRTRVRKAEPNETAQIYLRYEHERKEHPFSQKKSSDFTAGVNYLLEYIQRTEGPIADVDLSFSPVNSQLRLLEGTKEFNGINIKIDDNWEYPDSITKLMLPLCSIENLPLKPNVRIYCAGINVRKVASETLEMLDATGCNIEELICPNLRKLYVSTIKPQPLSPNLEVLYILGKDQEPLDLSQLPLKELRLFKVTDPTGWKIPERTFEDHTRVYMLAEALLKDKGNLPIGILNYLEWLRTTRGDQYLSMLGQDAEVPLIYLNSPQKEYPSLESQLVKLFPNAADVLDSILPKLDVSLSELEKVTDRTYSGVVFSFKVRDERNQYIKVYAKAGTREMLTREAQYMRDAWIHSILRPITPKCAGILETEKGAVLLTYGTENQMYSKEDEREYVQLRERTIRAYARARRLNNSQAQQNINLIDMFNKALHHIYMQEHMSSIYSERQTVMPFDEILSFASPTSLKEMFRELQATKSIYQKAAEQMPELRASINKSLMTLVNADGRRENVFPGKHRPQGDYGSVVIGYPYEELARLEISDDRLAVEPYMFMRQCIEKYKGNEVVFDSYQQEVLEHTTGIEGLTRTARLLSFHLRTNNHLQAKGDLRLLQRRAFQLQVPC